MSMKRGFPRPRMYVGTTRRHPSRGSYGAKWNNKTYPHPYSASERVIADIHPGRMKECVKFKICGTCGDVVEDDMVGLILYNPKSPKVSGRDWLNPESGPYHFKCLIINFTQCPHLVETRQFMPGCALWSDIREQMIDLVETY